MLKYLLLLLFLQINLIALIQPGFYEAKFYCDATFSHRLSHKHLNTIIDLLSFYGQNLYEFLVSNEFIYQTRQINSFQNKHIYII